MRLFKRLLVAATLVASAVFFVPAPAQAGGGWFEFCVYDTSTSDPTDQICVPVFVEHLGPRKWWPPECWVCDPTMDFWKDRINPAVRYEFSDYLGQGLAVLAQATFTEDEKLAEQLRAEAGGLFLKAATVVEDYEIALDGVGWIDPESGKYYDSPQPESWISAGESIAKGVDVLQNSLGKEPDIEGALKHFDEAYAGIAELAAS
jgi:hypothetical protein